MYDLGPGELKLRRRPDACDSGAGSSLSFGAAEDGWGVDAVISGTEKNWRYRFHRKKAYFLGLCKGISPENMALYGPVRNR